MNIRHILIALTSFAVALSCAKNEPVIKEETKLVVSGIANIQNVPAEQGTKIMNIVSNRDWTIKSDGAEWLHFSSTSGVANEEGKDVTVTYDASKVEEVRKASFTVTADDKSVSFTIIQDAYEEPLIPVELVVTGITDNKISAPHEGAEVKFQVSCNYAWSIEKSVPSFCTLTPETSEAGVGIEVTAVISESEETFSRQCGFTIRCKDTEYVVEIHQEAAPSNYDSHPVGYVFFEDDFAWVSDSWDAKYPKYGWVSAKTDGTNNNEYVIVNSENAKAAAEAKGYEMDALCYAKAEGYVKLGKAAQRGSFVTKAVSGIDADKIACLEVSFNTGMYFSASGEADTDNSITLAIIGNGTIKDCSTVGATISEDKTSVVIPIATDDQHMWHWTSKHILISGADNQTKFKIGTDKEAKGRCFVDNLKIARADNKATAAAEETIEVPELSYEMALDESEAVSYAGGLVSANIRVNHDWTITSDAAWLTISKIAYATGASSSNSDNVSIKDGGLSASVARTGMPYNRTAFAFESNPSESERTGILTISADGKTIGTLTVKQEGKPQGTKILAKWSWTGLYSTYTLSGNTYTNPDATLKAAAENWLSSSHSFNSDNVTGGIFKGISKTSKWSVGTGTQIKDRLRCTELSKDDYFQFEVANVTATKGSTIKLSGVCVATTNVKDGPCEWTEEYSVDGGNSWTKIKDIKLTAANITEAGKLDCEIELDKAIDNKTFMLRVRIASNNTASATFEDGKSNMAMIALNADGQIAAKGNTVAIRDEHYTDEWAYAVITLISE